MPLKIARYRDVCLGKFDPVTGQSASVSMQPGLACSDYLDPSEPLTWLTSDQMAQLQQNLKKDFSEVHCDHVLEVQYIRSLLGEAEKAICSNLRLHRALPKVISALQRIVNGKDNLLLLDGEINKLKGRYTTRVMTSNKYRIAPTLPEIEDVWLLKGVASYFSRIESHQLKVAGEIYDILEEAAGGGLGERTVFLARVQKDFTTLNNFFRKEMSEHPVISGWVPPTTDVKVDAEVLAEMEAELQASFELDDEDQEPLTPRQIRHLERNARLAASTQNPPKSAQSQCKRFSDSGTDSNGGPACELPNRTGLQSPAVNNNENLNESDTLPASSFNLLPSTPVFSEPEFESSTFFRPSSIPPAALQSSMSVLGNLNRPVASSIPIVVTQHRTPLRASPTTLSSFRQSPVNHFYSVSKSPIYYPRPIPTRVRAGRILTTRVGFIPSPTKMKSPFAGVF